MKKTTILSALAALLLAACTQDELTDASNDLRPVTITATIDPQIQSRATVSDSETPTRCFLEISDVDGDYNEIIRLDPTESTFTTALLLSPTCKYNLLFWADNVKDPVEGYLPPSLHYMEYTEGSLAYRVRLQNQSWSANGIKCELKHAVAKVTLRTTADLPAGRNVTMTIPTNYPCYSMYWDDVCSINASQFNPRAYTTPAKNDAVSAGGDVVSCYVLVPTGRFNTQNTNQTVKISHDGLEWTIPDAIPIKQNQHTIISGDVSKVGYSDFTYTVTTESMGGTSAGYDEAWGSEVVYPPYTYDESTKTYTVNNAEGLLTWANAVTATNNNVNCILAADIDLAGRTWSGVCRSTENGYAGTFDGAGHTIDGLSFSSNNFYTGFFYNIKGGTVKNVRFTDATLESRYYSSGIIANQCTNGTISNCHVSGKINGAYSSEVGGIVGTLYGNCTVSGCSFTGDISGQYYIGGIAGACSETDEDSGRMPTILGCSYSGNISAQYYNAGGIVGFISDWPPVAVPIVACHSSGTVISSDYCAGGILGSGVAAIDACYSTATITATRQLGAIAGFMSTTSVSGSAVGSISNSYYGTASTESKAGATQVDGSNVTWAAAMSDMNSSLTNGGYGWQYAKNNGTDANDVPLILVSGQ